MFDSLETWLPTCRADVLCLQEVTRTASLDGWTSFRDAERRLPQRADLFADVCARLPHHRGVFSASDAGPVSADDGTAHRQEFGLGTFVHSSLRVVDQRSEYLHGEFVEHDEWAIEDRPRVAHAVRVVDLASGRSVLVVQFHGVRDPAGKHDTPARRRQAERLVELIRATRRGNELTVVCGDMNVLPDSDTFRLLHEIGLTDLVGLADTRTSRYSKPVRHANYLLVSDPSAVRRFEIVEQPEVSDHRPLVVDL